MVCDVCINVGHMLAYVFFVYKYACKCVACETFTLCVYVNVWVHTFICVHICVVCVCI